MQFIALNDVNSGILTANKTMKMKFFSKKIHCISSKNVLNIKNTQNPKWLHVHFKSRLVSINQHAAIQWMIPAID